jgi:hypothetical protein
MDTSKRTNPDRAPAAGADTPFTRHHRLLAVLLGLVLAGAATVCAAAPPSGTETGDIRLEEGFVDPQSGVRVDRVQTDPASGDQEVLLAVPRSQPPIDEVVVTATRPQKQTLLQRLPHKFVADYNRDFYGLVIYLGRHEDVPLRLYLDSRQAAPGVPVP